MSDIPCRVKSEGYIIPVVFEAAWVLACTRSAQSHRHSMLRGFTRLPPTRNFNSFGYRVKNNPSLGFRLALEAKEGF